MLERGTNANGCGLLLKTFPTPSRRDYKQGSDHPHGFGQRNLNDIAVQYPTPTASEMPCEGTVRFARKAFEDGRVSFRDVCAIAGRDIRHAQGKLPAVVYPTPTVQDGENCGGPSQLRRHSVALNVLAKYPTIGCRNMGGASGSFAKLRGLRDAGQITEDERRTMAGGAQLNPDWVEWLMGWPVGWTDIHRDLCDWRDLSVEPDDISIATTRRDNRPARIKAIGNGQVPLCAAVAAESGFAFLEFVCGNEA